MKTLIAVTAAAMLAGGAAFAQADDPSPSAAMTTPDYLSAAGKSDMFEMQEGQLAAQMSSNAKIKAFGKQMIKEHTKSTNMVMAAAKKSGLSPTPPELGPDQQAQIAQLKSAQGAQFDKMYLSQQLSSHEAALSVQKGYAKTGTDKNLKMTATKIVPVVEHHIMELKSMGASST